VRQDALEVAAAQERFWAKVDKSGDCWLWIGAVKNNGYGVFGISRGVYALPHRVALAGTGVELLDDHVIDHLCRNPLCVNPDHLEQVPQQENVRRGVQGELKTHCPQGHPWVEENQYARPDGRRMCRICRDERNRTWKQTH
jgi:hypothetical protein